MRHGQQEALFAHSPVFRSFSAHCLTVCTRRHSRCLVFASRSPPRTWFREKCIYPSFFFPLLTRVPASVGHRRCIRWPILEGANCSAAAVAKAVKEHWRRRRRQRAISHSLPDSRLTPRGFSWKDSRGELTLTPPPSLPPSPAPAR